MTYHLDKILLTKNQISDYIKGLAKQLDEDYNGTFPLFVCILNGSICFFSDLIREMSLPLEIDFMKVSSYGNKILSDGGVDLKLDLSKNIKNREVVLIEDIIDSGNTLSKIIKMLSRRKPKSLKICTLLNKPKRRKVNLEIDYNGFIIDDVFVVGYGLDFNEKFRNLPDIWQGLIKQ